MKKKVKALFSQPREAPQPVHQGFQLQLQDLVLAIALPVASDGLRPVVLETAEEITPNEQLQVQSDALQGFQEALGDVARNYQTLEQRCLQSLQSSNRMLQLQQSNNKSIRGIAMGAVGVLVAILAIKLFSTF